MPRRRVPKRRLIAKDPKFSSEIVGVFVHAVMRSGKKSLAYRIVYGALSQVQDHFISGGRLSDEAFKRVVDKYRVALSLKEDETVPDGKIGLLVFLAGLENMRPQVEVRSNRIGGDTRQVPRPITQARGRALAFRFLKKAALARRSSTSFKPGDKGMSKVLALEIMDAYDGRGGAVKMCTDIHRMAKANQAYVYARPSSSTEAIVI